MLCPPFGGGYTGVYVIGTRAVLEAGGSRSRLKDRESWYIIPDHHPAIVEKAVFDTVQASQLRFSQPNKKKRDYPLKGKAFCGCCGHALSRTMQKTSYYYCRHSDADTLTTELSELLIDRVLVYSDKRIEIAYKIRDIFD